MPSAEEEHLPISYSIFSIACKLGDVPNSNTSLILSIAKVNCNTLHGNILSDKTEILVRFAFSWNALH